MTFVKGQSGNPGGRKKTAITDLSKEVRKHAGLALKTLIEICKTGAERNRLAAALALLDRGYGKPITAIDIIAAGRRLNELNADELAAFEARLVSSATTDAEPAQGDMFH